MVEGVSIDGGGEFVDFSVLFEESGVDVLLVGLQDGGDVLLGLGECLLYALLDGGEVFFDFYLRVVWFLVSFHEVSCFIDDGVCVFSNKRGDVFLCS